MPKRRKALAYVQIVYISSRRECFFRGLILSPASSCGSDPVLNKSLVRRKRYPFLSNIYHAIAISDQFDEVIGRRSCSNGEVW